VLNKYEGEYFLCPECKFLFVGNPAWLDEAYKNPINLEDTGLMARNIYLNKCITVLITFFFNPKGTFVDYAGGYGIFTRLMRDAGFNFLWYDPYCANLTAAGFEYDIKSGKKVEAVTAFEVFEHFKEPLEEIEKMFAVSENLFFSTELLPSPIPEPGKYWYYGFEHGQHISFYTTETLAFIAGKYGLNYYNMGSLHLFTRKKIWGQFLRAMKSGCKLMYPIVKKIRKSLTWEDHVKLVRSKE
jgi:hypothetical protein